MNVCIPVSGILRLQISDQDFLIALSLDALGQGCPNYSTKGRVAPGFCSNHAVANLTEVI